MHCLRNVLLTIMLALLAGNAGAQDKVNLLLQVPYYNQLFASDLDIEHVKSSGILFTARLQSTVDTPVQVRLDLAVNITLAGESQFQIASATTVPFNLDPGQVMVVTNVDISGDNPRIALDRYDYNREQFDRIKNVALATGKAPAGVYEFVVRCLGPGNTPISGTERADIVVTNPSRVELGLPLDGAAVTTLFPHFQWSSSVDTVTVSIFQKEPYQQTPEDVVSGVPFLRESIPNPSSLTRGSFDYPPSGRGVRPLQEGRTYYWYVEIPALATRGSGVRSDIWSFTTGMLPDTSATSLFGTGNSPANVNAAATDALKNLLSGTQWQGLLQEIDMLNGEATNDGRSISTEDLIRLLDGIDKSKITNVTVQN